MILLHDRSLLLSSSSPPPPPPPPPPSPSSSSSSNCRRHRRCYPSASKHDNAGTHECVDVCVARFGHVYPSAIDGVVAWGAVLAAADQSARCGVCDGSLCSVAPQLMWDLWALVVCMLACVFLLHVMAFVVFVVFVNVCFIKHQVWPVASASSNTHSRALHTTRGGQE